MLSTVPGWAKRELASIYRNIEGVSLPPKYGGEQPGTTTGGPEAEDQGKGEAPARTSKADKVPVPVSRANGSANQNVTSSAPRRS